MAGARLETRADSRSRTGPPPEPSPEYAHLTIAELRSYRAALADEERRVSYWRRIIQARCDVVRAGDSLRSTGRVGVDDLRGVLAEVRANRHEAFARIVPVVDDIPPLPDLATLWDRTPSPDDVEQNEALALDLAAAEAQLSACRSALHERIDAATAELIARYRSKPDLCLEILPSDPMRRDRRPEISRSDSSRPTTTQRAVARTGRRRV